MKSVSRIIFRDVEGINQRRVKYEKTGTQAFVSTKSPREKPMVIEKEDETSGGYWEVVELHKKYPRKAS